MTTAVAAPWPLTGLEPYRFSQGDLARLVEEGILEAECELAEGVVTRDGEPYRFSIEQYHRIGDAGLVPHKPRTVLLEGLLVRKMTIHDPHTYGVESCYRLLLFLLAGAAWNPRCQQPVIIGTSEPEPDVAVARGAFAAYRHRRALAADIALVVEVADSTLRIDRTVSARIYGGAGIPVYWIINLIDRQVEVMTQPTAAGYGQRTDHLPGQAVPVVLDGVHAGDLLVDDLLP